MDKAHSLDIKIIMDLVINHTSDEHKWFIESRNPDSPYRDYYFWRKGKGKNLPPNNWDSFFQNNAWENDEKTDEYYLHLFNRKQVDLNMDNPKVREEIKEIMRFWLDLGVDGFREDVITFISKTEGLPDDHSFIMKGMKLFESGPHIHEYLSEFRRDVLDKYDCFVVGEAPLMTPKKALSYIAGKNPDLDMMFHFDHMMADCFFTEYMPRPFKLRKLKRAFTKWQNKLNPVAWNALYMENHDHPRIVSRYGSEEYREESAKMLAASYLLQMGTPFVYQGQEIGMTNIALPDISDYKDCMAFKQYNNSIKKEPKEKCFPRIQKATRDNARTTMQWSDGEFGGFSTVTPWFAVNENYTEINVEKQAGDPDSVLSFYRKLIEYRTGSEIVRFGEYRELNSWNANLYVYERSFKGKKILVICSFTDKPCKFKFPKDFKLNSAKLIASNYKDSQNELCIMTKPYETRIYEC